MDRTIHWAARGTSPAKLFLHDKASVHDAMAQFPIWVLMGAIAAVIEIGQLALPRLGMTLAWTWVTLGVMGVGTLLLGLRFIRGLGRARAPFEAPNKESDPESRVRAFGDASALGAVYQSFDPDRRNGFDPAVYFAFFAIPPRKRAFARFWISIVAMWAAWFAWQMATRNRSHIASLEMMGIAGGVSVLWAACFPVYFRVSPGRLEVMRAGFLGNRFSVSESHDLGEIRLAIDAKARVVYLTRATPNAGGGVAETPVARYSYRNVPRGPEFAAMLLSAATCSVTAPELPKDRL